MKIEHGNGISYLSDDLAIGGKGPDLVHILSGSFMMGDPSGLIGICTPIRTIYIPYAFEICKTPITFEQYDMFATTTGRDLPPDGFYLYEKSRWWGRGNRPVINVSYEDAKAYASWISEQTSKSYRLPTEAEWEYAAQGGAEQFVKREDFTEEMCHCRSRFSEHMTKPVASFDPNNYGIYDMVGNVEEWVEDSYYPNLDLVPKNGSAWKENPLKPPPVPKTHWKWDAESGKHVMKGGSFNIDCQYIGAFFRGGSGPKTKRNDLGFRLVRDKATKKNLLAWYWKSKIACLLQSGKSKI